MNITTRNGGTENAELEKSGLETWDQIAGVEKTGLENAGPNFRGGKGGTGKRGNITCMGSEM